MRRSLIVCLGVALAAVTGLGANLRGQVHKPVGHTRVLTTEEMRRVKGAQGLVCPECTITEEIDFECIPPWEAFFPGVWNFCDLQGCKVGNNTCTTPGRGYSYFWTNRWNFPQQETQDDYYLDITTSYACQADFTCVTGAYNDELECRGLSGCADPIGTGDPVEGCRRCSVGNQVGLTMNKIDPRCPECLGG